MLGWRPRLWRVVGVVIAGAIATTCVRSETERCADNSRCAQGNTCVDFAEGSSRCARPDQLDICDGATSGPCTYMGLDGNCLGGACFVPICGDGIIDAPEVCDDSNIVDGDSCAASCRSDETCGNGVTDPINGEQCDDAALLRAGDGCSKSCNTEYRVWRDVRPEVMSARAGFALARDPVDGLLLFGGITGSLDTLAGGSGSNSGTFNDTWRWTGSSWLAVATTTGPSRRWKAAIAYDPRRKRVVMFGGTNGSLRLADTWEWNGYVWELRTPATSPPGRYDASMACDMQRCVLVGGVALQSSFTTYHQDMWTWDGALWSRVDATSTPSGRGRAAMAYDSLRDRIVLYGGEAGGSASMPIYHRDTWELAAGATNWVNNVSGGPTPPAATSLEPATAAFDPVINRVVLTVAKQTWTWNGAWSGPTATPAPTAGSAGGSPVAAYDATRSRISVIAQTASSLGGHDWNGTSWAAMPPMLPAPGARTLTAAYDEARGRSILLDRVNGTFEWNGVGWRHTVPAASSPSFYNTALVYDARCKATISFGGTAALVGPPTAQMSIYNGAGWTLQTVSSPPAMSAHAMTYDIANDAVILFGGRPGPGVAPPPVDELWIWSGATCATKSWQRIPTMGEWPTARYGATLEYDRKRERVVLFGGVGTDMLPLGDTWELAGTTWTRRTPAESPVARFEHGAAYDPRRERVVVFSGRDADAQRNDTWEWDGEAGEWRELATVLVPGFRSGMAMSTDVTGSVISIGGELGVSPTGFGPFRLRSELSLEPPETCDTPGDSDGDGAAACADPDCAWRCTPLCAPGTSCATCGDLACSPFLEDYLICPADCPAP